MIRRQRAANALFDLDDSQHSDSDADYRVYSIDASDWFIRRARRPLHRGGLEGGRVLDGYLTVEQLKQESGI